MKKAFVIFLLITQAFTALCQKTQRPSLYETITLLEQNEGLTPTKKLNALYQLKQKFETQKFNLDSGIMALYVKLAKYEFKVNKDKETAIRFSDSALKIRNQLSAKPIFLSINCFYNTAFYYKEFSDYKSALSFFDSVHALCRIYYDPDDYRIMSFHQKVDIEFLIGDYQEVIDESLIGNDLCRIANNTSESIYFLNRLAQSLYFEDQLDKSLFYLNIAEEKARNTTDYFELGTSYKTKALIYQKKKDFLGAEEYFLKAIAERTKTENYGQIASDYNDLANFYTNSLEDYKRAELNYVKTLKYADKVEDKAIANSKKAMATINLAVLQTQKKEYRQAQLYFNQAIAFFQLPIHNYLDQDITLLQTYSINNKDALFALLTSKIQLLEDLYEHTHDKSYLSKALKTCLLTDSVLTQARHEQFNEQSKLYWRNKTHSFFESAIDVCYRTKNFEQAFYFFEKSRSILLADKLNELSAGKHLLKEETNTVKNYELILLKEQMKMSGLKQNSSEYRNAQNTYLTIKSELDDYIKGLEKKHPLYYQYKYAENVPDLSSIQNYLDRNKQSMVYYFTGDTVIYALGITGNKVLLNRISASTFDIRILSYFISLCSNKQALNKNYKTYISLSNKIYHQLYEPFHLPKGRVSICADNFFIPFEALATDTSGKVLLISTYSINYVYSARSLIPKQINSEAKGNFIGFAPVNFSSTLNAFPLLGSDNALKNSARFYLQHSLFTKTKATKKLFFEETCSYSVVNIFSHAWADTTNSEPVLYMQDSLIHLSELQMLNKPVTQFVLLSACQTNTGRTANGEGIYSLARGFAAAGIPAISATLWKADEGTVYKMSAKFNEYLAAGMNKSDALQQAKLWYLQNSNREHALPFYWANMVLIGTSEPIVLNKTSHEWIWISIVIALIVVSLFLLYRKSIASSELKKQSL